MAADWLKIEAPVAERVRLRSFASGVAHGLCMLMAFWPGGLWWFVLVAPLPLAWAALVGREKPLVTAFWSALGVLPFWGLAHGWIASVSTLGFVPLAVLLSGFTLVQVWVSGRVLRRWPVLIVFWPLMVAGHEFLRGVVFLGGYPWYFLAHPCADVAVIAWLAPMGGTFLVSAFVAVPATAAVCLMAKMHRVVAMAMAGDCALVVVLGLLIDPWPTATGTVRVAIVQTNVPQSIKTSWSPEDRYADWVRMRTLIAYAARENPALIVLPEAMFPGMTLDATSLEREIEADLYWSYVTPQGVQEALPATLMAEELIAMQRVMKIPVLIGGAAYDGLAIQSLGAGEGYSYTSEARYNSVFVIDGGAAPSTRYDKVHLTPFGEVMPLISRWDWLEGKMLGFGARGMRFDLEPGRTLAPVAVVLGDGSRLVAGTPVCFEATSPRVSRLLGRDAEMLINLTNDGWFGTWDAGREHHLLTARWRAIELGKPLVRAANTGISCVVDERGRVIARGVTDPVSGEGHEARGWGLAVVEVPRTSGNTVYAAIGDIFGWGCLIGVFGAWMGTILRWGKKRKVVDSADEHSMSG
jgi:apolipoprotein N-acyltransferase